MFLTILLIILGVALAVVFFNRQKDEEKARLGIIGLTAAIIVLSFLRLIGVGGGGAAESFDLTTDGAMGEVFADRIAQAAKGKRVVIVADANTTNPFAAARLEAFKNRLVANGQELLAIASTRPQSILAPGETFPSEGLDARALEAALRENPEAEVLVSLAGFPMYNFAGVARQLERVEVFIFDEYAAAEWQDSIAAGVVDGIALQALEADWSDTSGSSEDIFNRRYFFVTRGNLSEVRQLFAGDEDW